MVAKVALLDTFTLTWSSTISEIRNAVWAATAHREADGREYHPLRWLAGMRECGQEGKPAYSKISYSKDRVWEEILRLPCQTDLEDGRAGGYSMSLEFLVLFFQEKSTEEKYEHYPKLKIINMNGRLYDPVIARFFSPDKYVANSSFTQDFNRYSYCRNNPLMYVDPSGDFFKYLVWGMHTFSQGLENWLSGVSNPWKAAAHDATNFINNVSNAFQVPIYQSDNFNVSAGIDMFNFGLSVNANYTTNGGLTLGASAGYSVMGGWFVNGGFSQQINDWYAGANIGTGKNYWGWNASVGHKYFSVGYGQTYYGSAPSLFDGQVHRQRTGTLSVNTPWSTFRMENDFFGDGKDRWRTSAIEASFGPVVIGTNVYSNAPNQNNKKLDELYKSKIFGKGKQTYLDSKIYSSPAWIGIKDGNMVTRIGINHPAVQDFTQNGWHLLIGSPLLYTPYKNSSYSDYYYFSPYFYTGYYNPFSLY